MKTLIALWFLLCAFVVSTGLAARPQVILGPGTGGANFRVAGHQAFNRTLSRDTTYILTGWYFVDSTYSITIQPGTLIRGDSASGGSLIIKRGAQIFAAGTPSQPIVFTSNKPAGTRVGGDWGGVILLGSAITNKPTTQQIEGGFGTQPNSDAMYGGSNDADNSGVLQYARIEFAGIAFATDNEINGLTLGGVGSGTTLDHIQVSFSNDDSFEWFGGDPEMKYLVAYQGLDDDIDTDFGFHGKLQFVYSKRNPFIFDASASSNSNGFESDNEGTSPFSALPRTKARISNATLIGPAVDSAAALSMSVKFERSAMLRRATEFSIYNSALCGWKFGIILKDTLTQRAAINDNLQVRHTSLAAPREVIQLGSSPATGNISGFDQVAWYNTPGWGNLGGTPRQSLDLGLTSAAFNLDATNNPVPTPASELATAGTAFDGRLTGDPFFTNVSYRGAFDPSLPLSQQWTAGWTNFDPQNYDPEYAVSVGILADWNMISNPVTNPTPDDSAKHIYPTIISQVFGFNSGYVVGDRMTNGVGYWGKFPGATSQAIYGVKRTLDSISVNSGWNMVGTISNPVDTSTITSVPVGLRGSLWFGFNAGYNAAATLVPGKAYWVKANSAGKFVLANGALARPTVSQGRVEDVLNSMTISDSRGRSQTLYFGADANNSVPVAMYAMPPAPPIGAFDARFATANGGSMVETYSGSDAQFSVSIQSDAYPLTVSWHVKNASYELTAGQSTKPMTGEGTMKIADADVNRISLKLVSDGSNLPKEYSLSQNYPNPFNPTTSIKYALPVDSRVTMEIYNVLGQRVATLVNENRAAGYHVTEWNGTSSTGVSVGSAVYFVRMSAEGGSKKFSEVRKLMLLK